MRAARAALVFLAACGRIGFDPLGGDGGPDADIIPMGSARSVLQLDRAAPAVAQLDVPLLVVLDATRADFSLLTGQGRVRFFDAADEAPLAFEIESYGITGPLIAWVRMPRVDPSGSSAILVRYGLDPGPTSTAAAWPSGYVAVWHMNESGDQSDSTGGNHKAIASGIGSSTGRIGDGIKMLTGDYLKVDDDPSLGVGSLTISGWIYRTQVAQMFEALVTRQRGVSGENEIFLGLLNDQLIIDIETPTTNGGCQFGSIALPLTRWDHLVLTYDTTAATAFLNGVEVCSDTLISGPVNYSANPVYIGVDRNAASGPPDADFFSGRIDEVRFEQVARTPAWIALQYATMTDALITYGAIQYD